MSVAFSLSAGFRIRGTLGMIQLGQAAVEQKRNWDNLLILSIPRSEFLKVLSK